MEQKTNILPGECSVKDFVSCLDTRPDRFVVTNESSSRAEGAAIQNRRLHFAHFWIAASLRSSARRGGENSRRRHMQKCRKCMTGE